MNTPMSKRHSWNKDDDEKMAFPSLPLCVTTDIFLRLPVKCIGRSRCVSKSWCLTLNDPDFIRMHLDQSKHNLNLVFRNFSDLYSLPLSACTEKLTQDLSSEKNKHLQVVALNHPHKGTDRPDTLVGSCDGILCVRCFSDKKICLWNPCTREYKCLPKSFLEYHAPYPWFLRVALGFGYSTTTKDYVVVKIDSTSTQYSTIDLFSLTKNSHRGIGQTPYQINFESPYGELVNGALHWVASHRITKQKDLLVAFDIGSERLREVAQPGYADKGFEKMKIAEIRGQLSICLFYPRWNLDCSSKSFFVTWLMTDYGVKESWIKLFKIEGNLECFRGWKSLYNYAHTGWFLVLTNDRLNLFNPNGGSCNRLEVTGADKVDDVRTQVTGADKVDDVRGVRFYTESMVKLNRNRRRKRLGVARNCRKCKEPGHYTKTCDRRKANGGRNKRPKLQG